MNVTHCFISAVCHLEDKEMLATHSLIITESPVMSNCIPNILYLIILEQVDIEHYILYYVEAGQRILEYLQDGPKCFS